MMAAILHAGAAIFFLQSLTHTTVANTLFVLGAIPFFAAILAWVFLREQPTRPTVIAMIAAFIGIAVMLGEGFGSGSVYGNLTALLAALCFAGYAVLIRRNRHIDMFPTLLVSMLLIMAVAGAVRSDILNISAADLILCIAWGGGLSGFTSICFVIASRHIAAAEVTLLMLLEFSLGPLWVPFWHHFGNCSTIFGARWCHFGETEAPLRRLNLQTFTRLNLRTLSQAALAGEGLVGHARVAITITFLKMIKIN